MAKVKKAYFCTACGYEAPKWLGKCPACGEWNTFAEEVVSRGDEKPAPGFARAQTRPVPVGEIEEVHHRRLDTGSTEVNRVLGGGMVRGSLVLLGGEPGIGKSTMALQLALGSRGLRTLYVSGEESPQQIKMQASRRRRGMPRLRGNPPRRDNPTGRGRPPRPDGHRLHPDDLQSGTRVFARQRIADTGVRRHAA